jgi:hypothetical protein
MVSLSNISQEYNEKILNVIHTFSHNYVSGSQETEANSYDLDAWKPNIVKPRFIIFVGGPEKERWIRESDRCGGAIH